MADLTLKFYPSVFLANALAAFILNLVSNVLQLYTAHSAALRSTSAAATTL